MTRQQFIQLVKADLRTQQLQVLHLIGLVSAFSVIGGLLVRHMGDQGLSVGSTELWLLVALAVLFAALAVAGFRLTGKRLLRCPHCRKCLGGLPAQVVVGCGRCGFCGGLIVNGVEKD